MSADETRGLRLLVTTAPVERQSELITDLAMAKSGFLLADTVTVHSFTFSVARQFVEIEKLSPAHVLMLQASTERLIADGWQWRPLRDGDNYYQYLERYLELERKGELTQEEVREKTILERTAEQCAQNLRSDWNADGMVDRAEQLLTAVNAGYVRFIDVTGGTASFFINPDEYAVSMLRALHEQSAQLFLDEGVADRILSHPTIPAGLREFLLHTESSAAKAVSLGDQLFRRLPLFEMATFEELADIRAELGNPLKRFKGALRDMARAIATASWDQDFPNDVEDMLVSRVEPAILDIEEQVRSNRYMRQLLPSLAEKPLVLPSTSGLGFLLASASGLPPVVTAIAGVLAGGAVLLGAATKDWLERKQEIERNSFFFYYRMHRDYRLP